MGIQRNRCRRDGTARHQFAAQYRLTIFAFQRRPPPPHRGGFFYTNNTRPAAIAQKRRSLMTNPRSLKYSFPDSMAKRTEKARVAVVMIEAGANKYAGIE